MKKLVLTAILCGSGLGIVHAANELNRDKRREEAAKRADAAEERHRREQQPVQPVPAVAPAAAHVPQQSHVAGPDNGGVAAVAAPAQASALQEDLQAAGNGARKRRRSTGDAGEQEAPAAQLARRGDGNAVAAHVVDVAKCTICFDALTNVTESGPAVARYCGCVFHDTCLKAADEHPRFENRCPACRISPEEFQRKAREFEAREDLAVGFGHRIAAQAAPSDDDQDASSDDDEQAPQAPVAPVTRVVQRPTHLRVSQRLCCGYYYDTTRPFGCPRCGRSGDSCNPS